MHHSQHYHTVHSSIFYQIKATDLLAYLGVLLAFYAYKYSVEKDFQNKLSSFELIQKSFDDFHLELNRISDWVNGNFTPFRDLKAYSPSKQWRQCPLDALKNLVKNYLGEISQKSTTLAIKTQKLIEKIEIYNSIVANENGLIIEKPEISDSLVRKLNEYTGSDFDELYKLVNNFPIEEKKLAHKLFELRRIRHEDLIGTENTSDRLFSLYRSITNELINLKNNSKLPLPWPLQFDNSILVTASLFIFLIIELCFK